MDPKPSSDPSESGIVLIGLLIVVILITTEITAVVKMVMGLRQQLGFRENLLIAKGLAISGQTLAHEYGNAVPVYTEFPTSAELASHRKGKPIWISGDGEAVVAYVVPNVLVSLGQSQTTTILLTSHATLPSQVPIR